MASGTDDRTYQNSHQLTFEGQSAKDYARQHVGNVYNNNTYQYTLRKQRSDETLRSDQRSDALLRAAAEGQTPRVSYLIRMGVDLDHSDNNGLTALHHAALSGFEDTVEALLAAGCDVNAGSLDLGTPLHLAAYKGRENVVHRLLAYRANVNATSRIFGSPLHCAALGGSYPVASILVEGGSDPSKPSKSSIVMRGALQLLDSSQGGSVPLWECEPLYLAALDGHTSVVKLLLDRHASVEAGSRLWEAPSHDELSFDSCSDSRKFERRTALMAAALQGQVEVSRSLLQHGAKVNAQDSNRWTALHAAAWHGHEEVVRALVEFGANVDAVDSDNCSPLVYASESAHVACVRTLLELKSSVDIRDRNGCTPLHFAVSRESDDDCWKEIVHLLLDHGVDRHALDNSDKWSALHFASWSGLSSVVELLIQAGLDVKATDIDGKTPLDLAKDREHGETVQVLRKALGWPVC